MNGRSSERLHPTLVCRAVVGIWLLLFPRLTLKALSRASVEARWVVAARVLGARHLVEAVAVNYRPGHQIALAGAVVDGIHAATASAVGAIDARHRRLTWINAGTAAAFCAGGAHHARALARPGAEAASRQSTGVAGARPSA